MGQYDSYSEINRAVLSEWSMSHSANLEVVRSIPGYDCETCYRFVQNNYKITRSVFMNLDHL